MTIGLGDADYGYICAGCHEFVQYGQCHECEGFDEGAAERYPAIFEPAITKDEINEKLDEILELLKEIT